jgi:ribonuclease HII
MTIPLVDVAVEDPALYFARREGLSFVCGVDEAGRGPLAGPVVVAAVLLHVEDVLPDVADSKTLSAARRQALQAPIVAAARAVCVVEASAQEIDEQGILNVTLMAMRRAVSRAHQQAGAPPMLLVVDGTETVPGLPFCQRAVVDADRHCKVVSAASILAKEHRDAVLLQLHQRYPQYGFDRHKGYGTAEHLQALQEHGPCPEHRRTFEPVKARVKAGAWDSSAPLGARP